MRLSYKLMFITLLTFVTGVSTGFNNLSQSAQADRMTDPVRVVVVGGGCRGEGYSHYATIHPERMQVRKEAVL